MASQLCQAALAEPSLNDLAARTELRAIETLTLSDEQFLTGDKNGKAVTIAGELRIPQGVDGRLPAVILLHGSGGVNGGHELWAKHFNEMGIASFLIDSFSGARDREHVHQPGAARPAQHDPRRLSRLDMLAGHSRIDPARIAVMGFSRGGQSALYASLRRFQEMWNAARDFAAAHSALRVVHRRRSSTTPM